LKGILDEFGLERNKFYYELNKRVIGFPNNHEIAVPILMTMVASALK
jgi:hypothetical protein